MSRKYTSNIDGGQTSVVTCLPMNPVTHLFLSWTIADPCNMPLKEKKLITWAGVVADLDGLTMVADFANRALLNTESEYYFRFHHVLTHGLPAAIVFAIAAAAFATNRLKVAMLALLTFHLHLVCDLIGSRGPDPGDIWPIAYLQPLSSLMTFRWSHQWELNAWPNILLTIVLMAIIFRQAFVNGYSPVCFFSKSADDAFVRTLRSRFE